MVVLSRAVSPWDSLDEAIECLLQYSIHSSVVLKKGKLAGIIMETDLVRTFWISAVLQIPDPATRRPAHRLELDSLLR